MHCNVRKDLKANQFFKETVLKLLGDKLCLLQIQIKGELPQNIYYMSKFVESAMHGTRYQQLSVVDVKATDFDLRNAKPQRSSRPVLSNSFIFPGSIWSLQNIYGRLVVSFLFLNIGALFLDLEKASD